MLLITDSQGVVIGTTDIRIPNKIRLINYKKGIKIEKNLAERLISNWFAYFDEEEKKEKIIPMKVVIEDGILKNGDYEYNL